jgi:hypothetical protein
VNKGVKDNFAARRVSGPRRMTPRADFGKSQPVEAPEH